ncbi:MAG: hypothetical protein ACFE9L_09200 [Candidatus Hodarchaeota archaeon]
MAEQNTKVEYYRPVLPKSMQNRIEKLFQDFPEVRDAYDNNMSKFAHFAILHLIEKEENLQLEKIKSLGR